MSVLFSLAYAAQADAAAQQAIQKGAEVGAKVGEVQREIKMLQDNLAKSLMINEALWELIRNRLNLSENDLNEKLYQIDMRDGQLDGRNQRNTTVECPDCHRKVSTRHTACIYCGRIIDDSVFRMT